MLDKTRAVLAILFIAAAAAAAQATAARSEEPESIPLEQFAQLPTLVQPVLSPDGRRLAGMIPIGGRHAMAVLAVDPTLGEAPVSISLKDADLNWIRWVNDERLIASGSFPSLRFGVELVETRLVGINRDGRKVKVFRLAKPDSGWTPQIQDHVIDTVASDPKRVLVSVDLEGPQQRAVFMLNANNGVLTQVVRPRRFIQHWLADQHGIVRLGYGLDPEEHEQHVVMRRSKRESFQRLDKVDIFAEERFLPVALDCDDPSRFLVFSAHETGRRGLYRYDIDERAIVERVFLHDRFDLDSVVRRRLTGCVIGVRYVDDRAQTEYFEEPYKSIQAQLRKDFPERNIVLVTNSLDERYWFVLVDGATSPPAYYLLDVAEPEMKLWALSYPDLDSERLAPTYPVSYKARDGAQIPGYVTYPPGDRRTGLPAVVMPHGGPGSRDRLTFDFLTQFLASRGYVVLQPNFRGSAGFGRDFEGPGSIVWGETALMDIEDGARWLVRQGTADGSRLCIAGGSYGGYAALMGAVLAPELYRCAVSLNGVTDPVAMLRYTEKNYWSGDIERESILGDREMQELLAYSPRHNADKIVVPVLLLHATNDRTVSVRQSKAMKAALEYAGGDVRLVLLQDDSHYLERATSRRKLLREMESFLDQHLRVVQAEFVGSPQQRPGAPLPPSHPDS